MPSSVGEEYLRIRNDSDYAVQIFEMDFLWRPKGSRRYTEEHIPTVWSITDRLDGALEPAQSVEHPINAEELGVEVTHVRVRVTHNRSNKLTQKRLHLKGPIG